MKKRKVQEKGNNARRQSVESKQEEELDDAYRSNGQIDMRRSANQRSGISGERSGDEESRQSDGTQKDDGEYSGRREDLEKNF